MARRNFAFGFEAFVVFPEFHAVVGWEVVDFLDPLAFEHVPVIAHEYEGGEGAVRRGIGVVGLCEVGEVLCRDGQ